MADFTGGIIDLSVVNIFDNIILGSGDVMSFTGEGTGGEDESGIKVLGNTTLTSGAIINLRTGVNLNPGSVTHGTETRSLNASSVVNGVSGTGGIGTNIGSGKDGNGGEGGDETSLSGRNGFQSVNSGVGEDNAGIGGAFPGGVGQKGGGVGFAFAGGGGGGAFGGEGDSCESVAIATVGNVSIASGVIINGEGEDGQANGGAGAASTASNTSGGGSGAGGGGAGPGGGHGGSLYFFHTGSGSESATKNLSGGVKKLGGAGGAQYNSSSQAGTAGTDGTDGTDGTLELIAISETTTIRARDIYEESARIDCEVFSAEIITERGIVWATTVDPTTADNKVIVNGTIGTFIAKIIGLSADSVYNVRAYVIVGGTPEYGDNIEFKTAKGFLSRPFMAN